MIHDSITDMEGAALRDLFVERLTVEDVTGCPETSARNYHLTLCKIPKERRSQAVMP